MNASIHEIGNSPTIEMFVGVLEATDRELTSLWAIDGNDEEYQQAYKRHWAVREAINAAPARTFSELKAKARALQIEYGRDEDFECHVPGAARELAKSLVEDILMLGAESGALA